MSNVPESQLLLWYQVLKTFAKHTRSKKQLNFFISNLLAVSDGLRVGFLNDRQPFLTLEESKFLLITLKEKGLVKETVHILNVGNRETLFVNINCLHSFVSGSAPSFQLLISSQKELKVLPFSAAHYNEISSLVINWIEKHKAIPSDPVLHPTKNICGSTLVGVCLGYPVVYVFHMSESLSGNFVQYELHLKSNFSDLPEVTLFTFTVPEFLSNEVEPFIQKWFEDMVSHVPQFSSVKSVSLNKCIIYAHNVAF